MGKRRCRRPDPLVCGDQFSIDVFLMVWEYLEGLCKDKEQFSLRWFLKLDSRLELLVSAVNGVDGKRFLKGLLFNGYLKCKEVSPGILSKASWVKADLLFGSSISLSSFPKTIKLFMTQLSDCDIEAICVQREIELKNLRKKTLSSVDIEVRKMDDAIVHGVLGCFLGEVDEIIEAEFGEDTYKFWRSIPANYIVVKIEKNYTSFYERSGETRRLIAQVILRLGDLNEEARCIIRILLEELFIAYRKIIRTTASYDSHMVGFGPLFDYHRRGTNRVSFFTSLLKVKDLVKSCTSAEGLQQLIDIYAATGITEILLGLYMWWCPHLLKDFVEFSDPYMDLLECDILDFERVLGERGPMAYQFYITRDYYSEMHRDNDATDFTICYVSHLDSVTCRDGNFQANKNVQPVDFVLGESGMRLRLRDIDVFAFRSSDYHGTAYRQRTANVAFIRCMAVNNNLSNLMARCRRAGL